MGEVVVRFIVTQKGKRSSLPMADYRELVIQATFARVAPLMPLVSRRDIAF